MCHLLVGIDNNNYEVPNVDTHWKFIIINQWSWDAYANTTCSVVLVYHAWELVCPIPNLYICWSLNVCLADFIDQLQYKWWGPAGSAKAHATHATLQNFRGPPALPTMPFIYICNHNMQYGATTITCIMISSPPIGCIDKVESNSLEYTEKADNIRGNDVYCMIVFTLSITIYAWLAFTLLNHSIPDIRYGFPTRRWWKVVAVPSLRVKNAFICMDE